MSRVMVCGVDCHIGDSNCNGYCTGAADRAPEAKVVTIKVPTLQTFINKKTLREYEVLYIAQDATNSRSGARVVVYRPINEPNHVYVRDEEEFREKFSLGSPTW